jgi:hypothetical protein
MWPSHRRRWGIALALGLLALGGIPLIAGTGANASARGTTTSAARCPQGSPKGIAPESWDEARHILAPNGAHTIRLCQYSGLNAQRPLSLVHSRLLTQPAVVSGLVRRFDGLPRFPKGGGIACPSDDGSQIIALLTYPHGRRVRISVGEQGCNDVKNGSVVRTASGFGPHPARGPRLLAQLKRLLHQA